MTVCRPKETSRWLEELQNIARKGSELITVNGWIQDQMTGDSGELCIISAGHEAAREAETPGLSHVLREVLAYLGHGENWNDDSWRTKGDVVDYLNLFRVDESLLEEVFGPRWDYVCHLCEMFGRMDEQSIALWLEAKDEFRDWELLQHLDAQELPQDQERRARTAVCAAVAEKCIEFDLRPNGPSTGLMTAQIIRPSLSS